MNQELKNEILVYEAEGQALGAVGAIVTLIVGVGVSVLVLIFVGALGGQTYNLVEPKINEIGNETVTSYLLTGSNASAVSLGHSYVHSGSLLINGSAALGNSSFTIDYTAGTLRVVGATYHNKVLNAAYNYGDISIRTDIKDGIISGFGALKQTGDYLPIIVLAVVISLVMVLVLGMTGLQGGGNTNTAL